MIGTLCAHLLEINTQIMQIRENLKGIGFEI